MIEQRTAVKIAAKKEKNSVMKKIRGKAECYL